MVLYKAEGKIPIAQTTRETVSAGKTPRLCSRSSGLSILLVSRRGVTFLKTLVSDYQILFLAVFVFRMYSWATVITI